MIRVKEFAKVEFIHTKNEEEKKNLIDIETISLSSEEELKAETRVIKKCSMKTPKPRKKRLSQLALKKGRTPKLPSQYKFHKIDEYFPATKTVPAKKVLASMQKNTTNIALENLCNGEKPEEVTSNQIQRNLKQVKIVLRRLSIDQIVNTTRKRKLQDDQTKLPQFIQYESSAEGYFTIHEQSSIPKQMPNTRAIDYSSAVEKLKVETVDNTNPTHLNGTFNDDLRSKISSQEDTNYCLRENTQKPTKINVVSKQQSKEITNKKSTSKKPKINCPYYKIIEDTQFAVDAFRYGDIDGVDSYFLTHFHADHYIGLKKSFRHKLYVSNISGRLVIEFIKVDKQYIRCLDINTPIIIDEVEVTALDANHCPGAVMYLFKFKTGKCILHTGDFRASPEMEEYAEFWNNQIDTIYLDTTYLSSKYDFLTQSESIDLAIQYCREFINTSTCSARKHLILCGAYKIGKEKVWLRIAQEFKYKVWIDGDRHKAMQCIQNDEIFDVLTQFSRDAQIHVLSIGNLSYQFIVDYVKQFGETFSKVLAIRPSGWEKQKYKSYNPNFANQISIIGVQYSEHSSYSELGRFVRFLQPKKVISTVPINSKNLLKTAKIPEAWLSQKLEPKTKSYQKNIMDFMVKVA